MHFLVVPANRPSGVGFWVQADDADEARLLVSLNVPGMENSLSLMFASCEQDDSFSPGYGTITGGAGQSYTIRRRPKKPHRT
jgi:hypothetical protein